mmetsp:Transcript_3911/g.7521  ORF Transcript_3911/g.7521 Transcript_3911/m.7521 type:complete len:88 (+) Transcript_3911:619-882(+)
MAHPKRASGFARVTMTNEEDYVHVQDGSERTSPSWIRSRPSSPSFHVCIEAGRKTRDFLGVLLCFIHPPPIFSISRCPIQLRFLSFG